MGVHAQSPIGFTSARPLGGAIAKTAVDSAGAVVVVGWWDREGGQWDAAFDAARHVQPFSKLIDPPSGSSAYPQAWAVPRAPLSDPTIQGVVFTLDETTGAVRDVAESLGWCYLLNCSNAF